MRNTMVHESRRAKRHEGFTKKEHRKKQEESLDPWEGCAEEMEPSWPSAKGRGQDEGAVKP